MVVGIGITLSVTEHEPVFKSVGSQVDDWIFWVDAVYGIADVYVAATDAVVQLELGMHEGKSLRYSRVVEREQL